MSDKQHSELRYGYTTGSCAAAGASAAYTILRNISVDAPEGIIPLLLPDGGTIDIPFKVLNSSPDSVTVEVIKDGGDDPDVTDKIPLQITVFRRSSADSADRRDYILPCGNGVLTVSSGGGIGEVTRAGLDCEPGHWAINKVPLEMISGNLEKLGFGSGNEFLTVSITAVGGEKIAERTLNSMVGVECGISILGTSGIVVPYSNAAYIKTIEVLLRSLAAGGEKEVVFTTGSRTRDAAIKDLPHLNDVNFIRIADYIADSLKAAAENEFETVHVACMPGKLYKYAQGITNTHAHKNPLTMDLMITELEKLQISQEIIENVKNCRTVSEAATILDTKLFLTLIEKFKTMALKNLSEWTCGKEIILHLYT